MVAALAGSGRLDINSPVDMREALWVMMTQVPAISSAAFATFDLKMVRVARRPDGQVIRDTVSLADLPRGLERFRELQTSHVTFWGALFWNDVLQQPVLNVRTPIRRIDDAFIGGLLATVALGDLSLLIGEASQESGGRYFILVGRDQRAGASPAGRSARPRPHRRPRTADHQGSRRSRAGADLVAADPQPADRPRPGRCRPCHRGRGAALGVRLPQAPGLRPRALAGRAILSAGGRHQRPRPADQRRHRRRRHARGRGPAGAADRAVDGALDPHHHLGRRVDRAAGVRPAVPPRLAAARDRRCRPQPRQGARRA